MIHCYQMNGYNIILDVHSGGVHVVDELFYRLAQEIEPPLPEVCPSALTEKYAAYGREAVASTMPFAATWKPPWNGSRRIWWIYTTFTGPALVSRSKRWQRPWDDSSTRA